MSPCRGPGGRRLGGGRSSFYGPLAFPSSLLGVACSDLLFLLFFLLLAVVGVFAVCAGRDPQTAFAIFHARILAAQIDALALSALLASLRKVTSAGAELRGNGGVGRNPVCESVFAVLNDAVVCVLIDIDIERLWKTYALLASYPS